MEIKVTGSDSRDIVNKIPRLNSINCGNALELLKLISDEKIDLTITSPPYDNLRNYNGYSFDFENIAKELFRITKDGGVVVWIVKDSTINGSETGTSFKQALFFKEIGFNIHDTMVWYKETFSFPNKERYRDCFEYMFIFSKGKPKKYNLIEDRLNKWAGTSVHGTSRNKDGNTFRKSNDKKTLVKEKGVRFNVWEINTEKNNIFNHPAVFPEQLAKDHILSWSNEGDLILDCFCGSGTTLKMAKQLNRNFIGIDISEEYCNISKKRIEQNTIKEVALGNSSQK